MRLLNEEMEPIKYGDEFVKPAHKNCRSRQGLTRPYARRNHQLRKVGKLVVRSYLVAEFRLVAPSHRLLPSSNNATASSAILYTMRQHRAAEHLAQAAHRHHPAPASAAVGGAYRDERHR
ncbi:hypothetical protein V5799_028878 [Amblyomma americanum]|uniref:Uncharacterized protein n=1 Tax=Amblyomma americanum TaxID=6943 RepID=A0AAQ4DBM3_AMBAM